MRIDLNFLDLARLWLAEGATTRSVAEDLGVSTTVVRRNAEYWRLPPLRHRLGGYKSEYIPTPEEIKAACEEIQKTWSPEERLARDCYAVQVVYRDPRTGYISGRSTGFAYLEGV